MSDTPTPTREDEAVEAAVAALLIELAFLVPYGTSFRDKIRGPLLAYKQAIEARAALRALPPAPARVPGCSCGLEPHAAYCNLVSAAVTAEGERIAQRLFDSLPLDANDSDGNDSADPADHLLTCIRCALERAALPPAPAVGTCGTCRWWEENRNLNGIRMGDGRCFKGVRVGSPTRQSVDGGLYTPATFGCALYEPLPPVDPAREER